MDLWFQSQDNLYPVPCNLLPCFKVVDIFGNDTNKIIKLEV